VTPEEGLRRVRERMQPKLDRALQETARRERKP